MTPIVWPLAAVMLVQAMLMVATVTVPVLAPELALATKIEPHWIGVYSSLVFVGALVSILLGGSLARRFGAVTMSQIALGISGLALIATASGTVSAITISAVIAGFGYGLATPAASQILANVTRPGRHGIVFSLKQSTVSLGGLIAGVLVPALVVGFGWRAATLFVGFLVIAGSVLIHPLRTSHDDRQPRGSTTLVAPLRSIMYVLNHPRLRILALITFTFAAAQNSTNAIFVTYLVEKIEVPLVLAGLIFSSMQITGMTTRIFLGWISDHFISAIRLLGIIGLLIAITLMALAFIKPTWSITNIFILAGLTGIFVTGWSGVYLAEIARVVTPEHVAIATGGTVFFSFFGAAIGPSIFSLIVAATNNYTPAFIAIGTAAGLVGVLVLRYQRHTTIYTDHNQHFGN